MVFAVKNVIVKQKSVKIQRKSRKKSLRKN